MLYWPWMDTRSFPAVSSIDISLKPPPLCVFDLTPLSTAPAGNPNGGWFSAL